MKLNINWDALGITTAVACAIHCAILPLFLTSLPLMGVNIINNLVFEILMIVIAFFIGSYSLFHGYRLHHHRLSPLMIFVAGMFLLILKQYFIQYETWLLLPAVVFIISSHLLNYRFCRIANHCHTKDCNH
jgi:hypothetical protein